VPDKQRHLLVRESNVESAKHEVHLLAESVQVLHSGLHFSQVLLASKKPLSHSHVLWGVNVAFCLQELHVVAELPQVAQFSSHLEHLNGFVEER